MSTLTDQSPVRSRQAIIGDLAELVHQDGFLYTFCLLTLENTIVPLDAVAAIDWQQRLSQQELALLLRFLANSPLDLKAVPSQAVYEEQAQTARDLLRIL